MSEQKQPQGYSKRPLPLLIVNIGYILMPIIYLALLIYFVFTTPNPLFGFAFIEYTVVLIILPIIVAVALYWMNSISWWFAVGHSTLLILHNIYVIYSYKQVSTKLLVAFVVFQIISALVIIYFIIAHSSFRKIFFNKRLRWWEAKARYSISIPARLFLENGTVTDITLDDISVGGVCVISNIKNIESSEVRHIEFSLNDINFESNIDYIWEEKNRIGLKFTNYSPKKQRIVKKIITTLEKDKQRKNGR